MAPTLAHIQSMPHSFLVEVPALDESRALSCAYGWRTVHTTWCPNTRHHSAPTFSVDEGGGGDRGGGKQWPSHPNRVIAVRVGGVWTGQSARAPFRRGASFPLGTNRWVVVGTGSERWTGCTGGGASGSTLHSALYKGRCGPSQPHCTAPQQTIAEQMEVGVRVGGFGTLADLTQITHPPTILDRRHLSIGMRLGQKSVIV